jgi:FMN phosphatase YigB (HAD superfamily)
MPTPDQRCELLILDYGGTYSFEYRLSNFEKIMQVAFGKIPNTKEAAEIAVQSREFTTAHLTTKEYVTNVARILDVPAPRSKDFEDITISVTNPPSEPMQRLVRSVRRAGLKVSLLSDIYAFEVLKTRPWGRYDGFDFTSFSAETGLTKRDPTFFEEPLKHFGMRADKALL